LGVDVVGRGGNFTAHGGVRVTGGISLLCSRRHVTQQCGAV
jgi:hypothetical protein